MIDIQKIKSFYKYINIFDLIFIFLFPIISFLITILLKPPWILSIILFFGVPSCWLSIRDFSKIPKAVLFSISLIPITFIINSLVRADKSWQVSKSIFPIKIINFHTIEETLWVFLFIYYLVLFYENFIEKDKDNTIKKRAKYSLIIVLLLVSGFLFAKLIDPSILTIKYFYLLAGLCIFLFPIIAFLIAYPHMISKLLKASVYFFYVSILNEISGVYMNYWSFPGENYLGWINMLSIGIPIEEFIYFFLLGSTGFLVYYEFFYDDRR